MRCSPDSSTTNESSAPPRPAAMRAVGSRNSDMSVESSPGKSPPPPLAWRRRQDAKNRPATKRTMMPIGTYQFASSQSISEPDSAGGGFLTTGTGFGAGAVTGSGVAVLSTAGGGVVVGVGAVV